MNFIKKNYFSFFLFFFIFFGSIYSTKVGITHDEFHDYNVWNANKNLILNFFSNKNFDTSYLLEGGKFYGVGFHYISTLIEFFISELPILKDYNTLGKNILSKHVTVFLLFVVSGLFFKNIIKLITRNKFHANLSTIFYLFYPYLLGHSFFNIKDIPFLTFWLICTYFNIKLIQNYFLIKKFKKKYLILLSFFTAYLLSIRISGILIFVQYLIFIVTFLNMKKLNFLSFIKSNFKLIIFNFLFIFIFFFILQPSYWDNPLLIFDSIKYMSNHIQTVCTTTLGECMKAQNLPASYLPIWFFFKLPIIIIIGTVLYFLVEKKIQKSFLTHHTLASLIFSTLSVIFLLILFNVNLYDEIRQVMFLVPLIFIFSLSNIYFFSKIFFYIISIFYMIFFITQNLLLFPYNYVWINNFSHLTKVQNTFELDYWGASTMNVSKFLKKDLKSTNNCVISNRNQSIKSLAPNIKCLIDFDKLHEKNNRPFYVVLLERNLNKGTPNNCILVMVEQRKLNFSSEKLNLAKVFKCD